MATAMFDIRFDPTTRILHLAIAGFWDRATAGRFAAELEAAVARIKRTGADFTCLSDATNFPPQSAAVAEEFGAMAATSTARRCAILVGSILAKLQASRTMANDRVRIFLDQAEAEAWLKG